MGSNWVEGADPSWFPRVLWVLQRDYPEVADTVWSTAIGENAERLASCGHEVPRFECAACTARLEAGPGDSGAPSPDIATGEKIFHAPVCRCGHKKTLHAGHDATGRCANRSCGCGKFNARQVTQ